jgi:hypothetical protein
MALIAACTSGGGSSASPADASNEDTTIIAEPNAGADVDTRPLCSPGTSTVTGERGFVVRSATAGAPSLPAGDISAQLDLLDVAIDCGHCQTGIHSVQLEVFASGGELAQPGTYVVDPTNPGNQGRITYFESATTCPDGGLRKIQGIGTIVLDENDIQVRGSFTAKLYEPIDGGTATTDLAGTFDVGRCGCIPGY